MRSRIFSGSLKSVRVNQLLWPVSLLCLCCVGEVSAIPLRLSYSVVGPSVAGVWMGQETGTFRNTVSMCSSFISLSTSLVGW